MVMRYFTGALLALSMGDFALAQPSVEGVGDIETATEEQRRLYEETRSDSRWLEQKLEAGQSVNRDDVLLDQALKAKASAAEIVGEQFVEQIQDRSGADAYLDAVQDLQRHTDSGLSRAIEEMIGGDPQIQALLEASAEGQSDEPPPARYVVAVSRSMGESALQELMEIAKQHPDMVLVFRGLLPGEKMEELIRFLMKLQPPEEGAALANVMIEPTVFSGMGITVAPTLLRLAEDGSVVAQARGVGNPTWIEERVQNGEVGDLGKFGETTEVIEEDMIVTMQRKLAESNAVQRAVDQKNNFWHHQRQHSLPTATKDRTRTVDPTVVVVDGIYGPDGSVIAFPGQKLNPFDAIPFTMTVVVFNGRDKRQVEWARSKVIELEGKEITLVTTEVDPLHGWDGYNELIETVGRHVYLLPPEMAERFALENVPATVEGGDRVLIVKEYQVHEPAPSAQAKDGEGASDARHQQKAG